MNLELKASHNANKSWVRTMTIIYSNEKLVISLKKKGKIETLIIEDPQLHLFTDLCMDSMIKLWA